MRSKLTHAEMLVMGIIWDTPKQLVLSEVVAAVNGRWCKDWKPQTVSTYLEHLVRKGYLKRHRNGKIYTYEPLKGKDEYMAVVLGALYDWYSPELKETDFVLKIDKPEARMSHLEINCHEEKALFLITASKLYDEGLKVLPEWIPFSEQGRPQEEGTYWVTYKDTTPYVIRKYGEPKYSVEVAYYTHLGGWSGIIHDTDGYKWATAWKPNPCPEPYKGEQE